MKKLYLLAVGLSVFQLASAQTINALKSGHRSISKNQSSSTANKTTTTLSRLIAVAYSDADNGNFEVSDSLICSYTGDRGYDEQLEEWKFDNSFGWSYDNGNFEESFRSTRTYNSAGRIATMMSEMKDGSSWVIDDMDRLTYTSSGLVDTYFYAYFDGSDWDSSKTINLYNTAGKSTGDISQSWDASTNSWENNYRNRIVLNTSNEPDSSIFESWDQTAGAWQTKIITKYTYASGKLANTVTHMDMNGTWVNGNRTSYTYHTNGKVLTELYESWDAMTAAWRNQNKATYTYSSSGQVTNTLRESYTNNAWVDDRKSDYTYNSFGQVLVETEQSYRLGQWWPSYQSRNYYEIYFPVSVKNTAAHSQLKLYPVPARDRVNVQLDLDKPVNVNISIFDMSGKVVKSVNLPTVSQYNGHIDVASLPAGNYVMKMTGAGGPQIQKLNIVK
jgi:hypothetical protein